MEENIYTNYTTSELAAEVYSKADLLYEFIIKYSSFMSVSNSYGTDNQLNMIESHLLLYVEDHPGISITELAKIWMRTKGAISQQIKKLEKWEYVEKRKKDNNAKAIHLFVTQKGKEMNIAHRFYDIADITQTLQLLLKTCNFEEILAFYKVIEAYLNIL